MELRVLIAEDEYYTRKSIVQLVQRYTGLFALKILEAENGTSALELVAEDNPPDIVLADIKMNQGDGFSLVRSLKAQDPNLQAVFITGYTEFSYAKEAIAIGVEDYLVKPVTADELYAVLDKATEALCLHMTDRLRRIVQGRSLRKSLQSERLSGWFAGRYMPLLIYTRSRAPGASKRICARLLGQSGLPPFLIVDIEVRMHPALLVLFFLKEQDGNAALAEQLSGCREALAEALAKGQGDAKAKEYLFAAGSVYAGADQIPEAFNEVFFKSKHPDASTFPCAEEAHGDFETKLCDLLHNSDYYGIETLLKEDRYLSKIDARRVARLISLLNGTTQQLAQYHPEHAWQELIVEDLIDVKSPEELQAVLLYQIHKICHRAGKEAFSAQTRLVQKVKDYLDAHYQEDIVVKDLAEQVFFVHSKYLSSAFSKYEDCTISDYILQKRMEQAHQLLKTTALSITEVAGAVGYNNLSYFIQKFKKFYGVTPSKLAGGND